MVATRRGRLPSTGNVRRASSIEKRIQAISEERSLHNDAAVTGPARLLVEALLPQLRVL